jgi:transposase
MLIDRLEDENRWLKAENAELRGICARLEVRLNQVESELAATKIELAQIKAEGAASQAKTTSANSSQPPSRDFKGKKPKAEPKQRPIRPGFAEKPLHPAPTEDFLADPTACPNCGGSLTDAAAELHEEYDAYDIPPVQPIVTRVKRMKRRCSCGKCVLGQGPAAFGSGVTAMAFRLRYVESIAFKRLTGVFLDVFGIPISQGALVNLMKDALPLFLDQAARLRIELLTSVSASALGAAMGSDETGVRKDGDNAWLWIFESGRTACFVATDTREQKAIGAFLGCTEPRRWISDRYAGQMGWAPEWQPCLAHLIRDLQKGIDGGDDVFSARVQALLREAIHLEKAVIEADRPTLLRRLTDDLDFLLKFEPFGPSGAKAKKTILSVRNELFRFVADPLFRPTNNDSERGLRPAKTFLKVTNGFRQDWGHELYAAVRTVLETARRREIDPIEAIRLTLANEPLPP